MSKALKLFEIKNGKPIAGTDGISSLSNLSNPLCVVSNIGPCRTGKSFLLNFFLQRAGAFTVGNGGPVTKGADFLPETFSIAELCRKHACTSLKEDLQIALVDSEGGGDHGREYDIKVSLPILVISSAVIFNLKSEMRKEGILEQLAVLAHAAQLFEFKKGDPAEKIFGHLHVVIRDWTSTLDSQAMFNLVFKEEIPNGSNNDEIRERNERRRLILRSFKSVKLHCLPHAASQAELSAHESLPLSKVSPAFNEAGNALMEGIWRSLIGSPQRTGPVLATLLKSVLEKMATNTRALSFCDLMRTANEKQCQDEVLKVVSMFLTYPDLPMEDHVLKAAIREQLAVAQDVLRVQCEDLPRDIICSGLTRLKGLFKRHEEEALATNDFLNSEKASDALRQLQDEVTAKMSQLSLPVDDAKISPTCAEMVSRQIQKIEPSIRSKVQSLADPWRSDLERDLFQRNEKRRAEIESENLRRRQSAMSAVSQYERRMTASELRYMTPEDLRLAQNKMRLEVKLQGLPQVMTNEIEMELSRADDRIRAWHERKMEVEFAESLNAAVEAFRESANQKWSALKETIQKSSVAGELERLASDSINRFPLKSINSTMQMRLQEAATKEKERLEADWTNAITEREKLERRRKRIEEQRQIDAARD
eukprot:CAMPEP_0184332600 /NCGR_PEP_ID=MMETSP1089-20130417/1757_1 /TAXON_ID=38269 ORGANISM="Gloeochaete wittrockiana, Strain SAG46.84" /NCGR_SAMPLE_ID=MMETSP1089 /ASSEMBLY_ACC=CAM_ASM_000445 /LENGTH=649 /DNA_ID=CAMNT_0026656039 /DNA_START=44 /DNA_END=1990 /DNA_ORIENTATION=-